jgi:hypothetical protein
VASDAPQADECQAHLASSDAPAGVDRQPVVVGRAVALIIAAVRNRRFAASITSEPCITIAGCSTPFTTALANINVAILTIPGANAGSFDIFISRVGVSCECILRHVRPRNLNAVLWRLRCARECMTRPAKHIATK